MIPGYWQSACVALAQGDPVMAGLVERFSGPALVSRGDAFATLARAIVGQQISVKAADSVWLRLSASLPGINPAQVLASTGDTLRACGLSLRKVEYLGDLARHFGRGQIHQDHWDFLSDEQIIAELTAVRGIGIWSAQMFLIFNLLRPDVFPLDDIGLQKAVALHYCTGERPSRALLAEHGERWRPWRSVATWYLWRGLDPLPVAY
jgi:DNA-3-methyladenine glycosylase II